MTELKLKPKQIFCYPKKSAQNLRPPSSSVSLPRPPDFPSSSRSLGLTTEELPQVNTKLSSSHQPIPWCCSISMPRLLLSCWAISLFIPVFPLSNTAPTKTTRLVYFKPFRMVQTKLPTKPKFVTMTTSQRVLLSLPRIIEVSSSSCCMWIPYAEKVKFSP